MHKVSEWGAHLHIRHNKTQGLDKTFLPPPSGCHSASRITRKLNFFLLNLWACASVGSSGLVFASRVSQHHMFATLWFICNYPDYRFTY